MKDGFALSKISPCSACLLLLPLGLLALILLIPNPSIFQFPTAGLGVCGRSTESNKSVTPTVPDPEFRLLIGILTVPKSYERRHILRLAYTVGQPKITSAQVDVKFVFCNVDDPDDAVLIALEIINYDDIMILNCTENMNNGKTYTYFSSAHRLFGAEPYDFVMKADDDTYLRLGPLIESLRHMPREDLYYGSGLYLNPDDKSPLFMVGMGYILSKDLVEWVATEEEITARNDTEGAEDIMTGKWLNIAGKGKNRYSMNPVMYNYRGDGEAGDFETGTIAVHVLKDNLRWARTLRHFNVTEGVKPSKLHHLP